MSDTPTRMSKFLTAVAGSIQSVEDALQQLYTERRIDTAVATQLDVLGRIVGQPRLGLSDSDYRRHVRARIATNRSNGSAEDIIKITRLVLDDDDVYIHVEQQQVATVVVDLRDTPVAYALAQIVRDFLTDGVSAGVRLIVEFTSAPLEETFSFAALGGGDGPGLGFGSFADPEDGGAWSAALS